MRKTMFILGSVETLLGILLWSLANLLKNIMPVLGRVAFQAAMKGSFSPDDYVLNTRLPTVLALVLIAAGIVQILVSVLKKAQ